MKNVTNKSDGKSRRNKLESLLKSISKGLYERDDVLALALLSAIAGESIFLLGLPGVGKSLVGRRLKLVFRGGSSFEYLMSRFSTPDEIFGPVSISKLKNDDIYERKVEGYLPSADVIFLDEIWKAGPSIQNSLLTVLNEKIYRNGSTDIELPLKGIIAASNELPAKNEGLEAIWDRFLVRTVVEDIKCKKAFREMVSARSLMECEVKEQDKISADEYILWQREIDEVEIGDFVFDIIDRIKSEINIISPEQLKEMEEAEQEMEPIIISDRRWKNIIRIMRASAYSCQRKCIDISDLLLIPYCLWNEQWQLDHINQVVKTAITDYLLSSYNRGLEVLNTKVSDIQKTLDLYKKDFKVHSGMYYNIVDLNSGATLLPISLYDSLTTQGVDVLMNMQGMDASKFKINRVSFGSTGVKITIHKSDTGVVINGRDYLLESKVDDELDNDLQRRINECSQEVSKFESQVKEEWSRIKNVLRGNIFIYNDSLIVNALKKFSVKLRKTIKLTELWTKEDSCD